MLLSFHQVYIAHVCSLKQECRGGLTELGPSVSATVCFTMTHPPPNTSTHRSHPCHRSFPVSVRASNRKGTLDQWPSDSRRLITSHSSPTSLFWAPLLLGEQLFTALCLPINLFMLFFSILFITSFSDIHITRPLNHSKAIYMPATSFVGFGCRTTKQIKYNYNHSLIALIGVGQLLSGECILQTSFNGYSFNF